MLLAACCLLLAAKPGRSTLNPKKGYKTKTGSTSSVTLTLMLALVPIPVAKSTNKYLSAPHYIFVNHWQNDMHGPASTSEPHPRDQWWMHLSSGGGPWPTTAAGFITSGQVGIHLSNSHQLGTVDDLRFDPETLTVRAMRWHYPSKGFLPLGVTLHQFSVLARCKQGGLSSQDARNHTFCASHTKRIMHSELSMGLLWMKQ